MRLVNRRAGVRFLVIASWIASPLMAEAQSTAANKKFETVRITRSSPEERSDSDTAADRVVLTAITVWDLIRISFPIHNRLRNDLEMDGGPVWAHEDRFNIVATYPTGFLVSPSGDPLREAQRDLLADHFGFRAHTDVRQVPIFVVERLEEPQLGTRIQAALPCNVRRPPPPPPPPGGLGSGSGSDGCGGVRIGGVYDMRGIWAESITFSRLASLLSDQSFARRPVEDRTGLDGVFDISLTWQIGSMARSSADPAIPLGSDFYPAIQEQLGVRMRATEGPAEVLVIDGVSLPTGMR